MKLTKLFAMMFFVATPLSAAQTLSFNLDTVTESNVVSPEGNAPWVTTTMNDLGLNQVELLITLNLIGDEFMSNLSLNINPALLVNDITFSGVSTVGQFSLPTITQSTNGVNGGQATRFDLGFDFSTSNASNGSRRFNNTDTLRYVMTYSGAGSFTSQSLNYFDDTDTNTVIAHIQGIGCDATSAWITGGPPENIPEPRAAMLLGSFGLITLLRRRK